MRMEPPSKRQKKVLFDNDSSDDESDAPQARDGASNVDESGTFKLNVNQEFAKRFEHNKKREELQQCTQHFYQLSINEKT